MAAVEAVTVTTIHPTDTITPMVVGRMVIQAVEMVAAEATSIDPHHRAW